MFHKKREYKRLRPDGIQPDEVSALSKWPPSQQSKLDILGPGHLYNTVHSKPQSQHRMTKGAP